MFGRGITLYYILLCLKMLFGWVFKIKIILCFTRPAFQPIFNPTQKKKKKNPQLKNNNKKNEKIKILKIKTLGWSSHP